MAGRIHADALTINGRSVGENVRNAKTQDDGRYSPYGQPLMQRAGFKVLVGNLFDSAVMKTSVISKEFRDRYLSDPAGSGRLRGTRLVFDGPETITGASTTHPCRSMSTPCCSCAG